MIFLGGLLLSIFSNGASNLRGNLAEKYGTILLGMGQIPQISICEEV